MFEGKKQSECRAMVQKVLMPIGMAGRVKMLCRPPSEWNMFSKGKIREMWKVGV